MNEREIRAINGCAWKLECALRLWDDRYRVRVQVQQLDDQTIRIFGLVCREETAHTYEVPLSTDFGGFDASRSCREAREWFEAIDKLDAEAEQVKREREIEQGILTVPVSVDISLQWGEISKWFKPGEL